MLRYACLCLLVCLPSMARAEQWPSDLAQAVARAGISLDGLSVHAQAIGDDEPVLDLAGDVARNPASTMKLITTLAALEELGPQYSWKTEAYTVGKVRAGRLQGDLHLKGYGDPYLITESFWALLNGLRQSGLTHIGGDLVLDGSYLQPDASNAEAFDGQKLRAYNAPAAALLVNFQAVNLRFIPEPRSRKLRILADPHPADLVIENKVKLTRGFCRDWTRRVQMQVVHAPPRHVLRFIGSYPGSCGEHEMYRVISDAPAHVFGVFKSLWLQQGGTIAGGLREATLPANAERVYAVDSRPLADILRSVNKYSNNVMTRQLVLTLGAERVGAPGTTEKGLQVIRRWLAQRGFEFPELMLENGVGLSRVEQISARHLGDVLRAGYDSRYMPEFISSLPIAGVDGTLQKRFIGAPWVGRLHAKTGSLDGVRTLAGYLLDARGRRIVLVILHNHAQADGNAGARLQQLVLAWLDARP